MTAEEILVKHEVFKTADKDEAFNLIFHRDAYRKAQSNIYNAMIEFAQYHVEQALKAASDLDFESIKHPEADDYKEAVKFTIIECYPKKNIK